MDTCWVPIAIRDEKIKVEIKCHVPFGLHDVESSLLNSPIVFLIFMKIMTFRGNDISLIAAAESSG